MTQITESSKRWYFFSPVAHFIFTPHWIHCNEIKCDFSCWWKSKSRIIHIYSVGWSQCCFLCRVSFSLTLSLSHFDPIVSLRSVSSSNIILRTYLLCENLSLTLLSFSFSLLFLSPTLSPLSNRAEINQLKNCFSFCHLSTIHRRIFQNCEWGECVHECMCVCVTKCVQLTEHFWWFYW